MENNQEQPSQEVLDRLFEKRNDPNVLYAFNHHYGVGAAEKYLDDNASVTLENEALVIPEVDIQTLRDNQDNPAMITAFNRLHGAGQAEVILRGTPQDPQGTPEQPDEKNGVMYDTLVQGPLAGLEDVADGLLKAGSWVADAGFGVKSRVIATKDLGFRLVSGEEYEQLRSSGKLGDGLIDFVDDADTGVGRFIQGVTTFAVPYVGMASKVAKGGKLAQGLLIGAAVDGVIIDPNDPNLTASLKDMGADMGFMTDLLATDVDDPEWQNRLRNVAEGSVLGLTIESLFYGLKAAKAMRNGDNEAAQEFLQTSKGFAEEIDTPIRQAADEVAEDAQKTIDTTNRVFPQTDVDGQMALDLDLPAAPAPRVQPDEEIKQAVRVPFRLTPEQVESIRYNARLAADDPAAAAAATNITYKPIDDFQDYDDVVSYLAAQKHVMKEEFLAMKGGEVQRWNTVRLQAGKQLRSMADTLGKDPDAFLNEITRGLNVPQHELAAELISKHTMLMGINREVASLAKQITEGRVTDYATLDEAKLALQSRIEIAANLGAVDAANRSNVARALAAQKMIQKADKQMANIIKNSLANSDVEAVAKAIVNADQPLKEAMTLGKGLQKTMDMVNHYRINALLSGVGTQQVNLIGTAVNSVMIPLQQILGGQVKHGARTLAYQLSSSLEAMRVATQAFKEDGAILDVLSSKFDMSNDFGKGKKGPAMSLISAPSRFLLTMDEFFKQSVYRGRIMADAAMEADNLGLKGAERAEFMRKYIADSFGQKGQATEIRGEALLQAQRSSFTEGLEAGSIGQKFQSLGQGKGVGSAMFRFILPFVRTPINILSQSFQNTPVLQFASKRFKDDLRSGDPIRAAQARGKIMTGVALTSIGYFLAGRGDFTGSGPTDPRIRAEWLKNNQPYSIKINNEDGSFYWMSYQRLEPLANVLSIFADVNEIARDPYNERESSKVHITAALALAVAENTINKTFTKGLSDLFSMMTGDPIKSERAFYSMVGSFVPNILNQTNGDEAFREVRSMSDAVLSRVGLFDDVDPKRNVMGEIITRPTPKYDPMGMSNIGNYREEDVVIAELSRLSIADQSAFSNLSATMFIDGKNQNLKDIPYGDGPQSIYDKVLEQTSTTKIDGLTLREYLAREMSSESYNKAIDGKRGLGSLGTKGERISKIINAFRDKAKSEIPEYMELERQSLESKRNTIKQQLLENSAEISKASQDRFASFTQVFSE